MQRLLALVALTSACSMLAALPSAAAEPVPGGTIDPPPTTAATKELDGQGSFGTATERTEETSNDALEWDISLGTLLSTGNAKMFALNGNTNFLLRRDRHQLTVVGLGNYGRAAAASTDGSTGTELVPTIGNVQGRLRYDLFLSDHWSLFAMATARHDPFQYLDLRLNVDPGVAWYIVNTPKERLTAEVGYDFQLDVHNDEAVVRDAAGEPVLDDAGAMMPLERTRNTHAVRLAGGYVNTLNEAVTFRTGLEYLQSVQDALRWRVNWDVGLTTSLFRSLALTASFNLRIDNDPLPGVRSVDTVTALSLLYRFF